MSTWFAWGLDEFDIKATTDIPDPVIKHYHKVVRTYKDPRHRKETVMKTEAVSNTGFTLIIHLFQLSKTTNEPELGLLAERMNYTNTQGVRYVIQTLEAMGLLTVSHSPGKPSHYNFAELSRAVMIIEMEEKLADIRGREMGRMEELTAAALEQAISNLEDGNFDPKDPSTNVDGSDLTPQQMLTGQGFTNFNPSTNVGGSDLTPQQMLGGASLNPSTNVDHPPQQMYRGSAPTTTTLKGTKTIFEEMVEVYKPINPIITFQERKKLEGWQEWQTPPDESIPMWLEYAVSEAVLYKRRDFPYVARIMQAIRASGGLALHTGEAIVLTAEADPEPNEDPAQVRNEAPSTNDAFLPDLIWGEISGALQTQMTQAMYANVFGNAQPVWIEDGVLTVRTRTRQAAEWIEYRLQGNVDRAIRNIGYADVNAVNFIPPEGGGPTL